MRRKHPEDEPHKATLGDLSLPLGVFFMLISLVVLAETNVWGLIMGVWDPELAKPSKYNPLSPGSLLVIVMWYGVYKILKWFFRRPNYIEKLYSYYMPEGENTRTYDAQGRLLILFFLLGGFINLFFYFTYGLYGFIPLLVCILIIEIWIRYEFECKVNNQRECDK